MKKIYAIVIIKLFTFIALNAQAQTQEKPKVPAKLQHKVEFIFEKVLALKKQALKKEIPFPTFYFESQTPLKQFQDAIEKQWGFRPDIFTNAFAVDRNEVYILDDADYYQKHKRCMDDSIAHELVHYIQVKYQGWDLNDESLEWDAVDIQTAFRQEFCQL